MGIIKSTVKVGQKPSKAEMARIRKELGEAKKRPLNLDDIPELPPDALKEFALMAAERNRQQRRQAVTIRVVPDCLSKYKALGKGYTGIMADVLNYVVDNPEILSRASGGKSYQITNYGK
jgi:uncharacterized protein (DUF4415 family)